MACCNNNSCAACSQSTRDENEREQTYWNRIHKGGPGLSLVEKQMHLSFKHNERIYRKVALLQKRIETLLEGIKK